MSALWGISASNIFGVCHNAAIVHFDGKSWNAMEHNVEPREFLKGVWGSSATDVFAVGENGMIMHYDGVEWTKMKSPTTEHLYGIWGSSSSNVYAVGAAGTILYYNGLTWSADIESGTTEDLRAIWGIGGSDIYSVGDSGTILHYDGVSWSEMESNSTAWLLGILGTSDANIYAVGGFYDGVGGWFHPDSWDGGVILHYDGNVWSEIKTDIDSRLFSIWGSSETNIYTVGAQATILHFGEAADGERCFFENLYEDNSDKVTSLRNFRDGVLSTTLQGKLAIRAYYTLSPYLIKFIKNNYLRTKVEKSIDVFLHFLGVVDN